MQFKTIHLILATALTGIAFKAYVTDEILFRQILFVALLFLIAGIGSLFFTNGKKWKLIGGILGLVAWFCFLGIELILFPATIAELGELFDRFSDDALILRKYPTVIFGGLLAIPLGSALASLMCFRATAKHRSRQEQSNSWLILLSVLILLGFDAADRHMSFYAMRNWGIFALVGLAMFVIYTISWTSRAGEFETEDLQLDR